MAICAACKTEFTPKYKGRNKYCSQACFHSLPVPKKSLAERFWKFVKKTDECWLWTASGDGQNGYGRIKDESGRRNIGSHRASWIIHFGPIPEGLQVCHRCDNPPCIRPDHLFLGSNTENQQDSWDKGRREAPDNRGSKHGMSIINEETVLEIRRIMADAPYGHGRQVAKQFGISPQLVSHIKNRKLWTHI